VAKKLEDELLDMENQYWRAIQEKDAGAATRLTDDECIVAGAQGVGRIAREALSKMVETDRYTLHSFKVSDVQVRSVSDDVAIVGYKVHEELTVQGKPVTLDAADASVWIRRADGWKCALHTESILGDPFGRDRVAK
jgi:ketosteroid isomerase-like protein